MKVSYKVLKKYIPNIKSAEEVAKDLIMHTAEVEDILFEGENLEKVYIGKIKSVKKHPDSEKLNCTIVEVNGNNFPIVCGAANVKEGMKVPVAISGAQLSSDFVIKKTKIRGEISDGMICSEDELGLVEERQKGILELPDDAPLNVSMKDYLEKNDIILEIDNKAINHRPDLFSHIGIIREIYTINNKKFDFEYEDRDFTNLEKLGIKNEITSVVSRYIGLKINNVSNIKSPEYIIDLLRPEEITSKGLLVDISNYSLYLYGQPTHCFDADKINGNIIIRYAKDGEKFVALNDHEYKLSKEDIVIADEKGVIALGGVIGGKYSAVSDTTKSIIVEGAHFDQAIVRKTGKRLGIRTDALNVFEKDIVPEIALKGVSLIANELEKNIKGITLEAYNDIYPKKQKSKQVEYDLNFINKLIGKDYSEEKIISILKNLGIEKNNNLLSIPFWRKDIDFKADIAEEIARIDGYDNIPSTVPRINLGAIKQTNTYKIKNDARNFFTSNGYFDMYTYSFVNTELMEKLNSDTKNLVTMKNALSEELTHMRGSLIPNLLLSLEKNSKEYDNLKLFELEKIFKLNTKNEIDENYSLAGVEVINKDIAYYDIQNTISNFFKSVGVNKYTFDNTTEIPKYAHSGRIAKIIVWGQEVGIIGEIHPKILKNFGIESRVGFFEINIGLLQDKLYSKTKTKDISSFQENNFDLNFVVEKNINGKDIYKTIENSNPLITKVELIDIYENNEKLNNKRSLTFKIYIQSMEKTLDDKDKATIIDEIVKKVEKKGGELRTN